MKDKILQLMQREGLKPGQLAELLDFSPAIISHILSERNKPSLDLLRKILRRFPQINPDWLLLDDPNMYRAFPEPTGTGTGTGTGTENGAVRPAGAAGDFGITGNPVGNIGIGPAGLVGVSGGAGGSGGANVSGARSGGVAQGAFPGDLFDRLVATGADLSADGSRAGAASAGAAAAGQPSGRQAAAGRAAEGRIGTTGGAQAGGIANGIAGSVANGIAGDYQAAGYGYGGNSNNGEVTAEAARRMAEALRSGGAPVVRVVICYADGTFESFHPARRS